MYLLIGINFLSNCFNSCLVLFSATLAPCCCHPLLYTKIFFYCVSTDKESIYVDSSMKESMIRLMIIKLMGAYPADFLFTLCGLANHQQAI